MTIICKPDFHIEPTVIFAAYHPMKNNATLLIAIEAMTPVMTSPPTKKKGTSGINEPATVDAPTRTKLRRGSNACTGASSSS